MNETVKATLAGLPKEFVAWLESLRNKNPLKGSNAGQNSNSVFVEIGKNLIVDQILAEREEAINPHKPKAAAVDGSEIMTTEIIGQ